MSVSLPAPENNDADDVGQGQHRKRQRDGKVDGAPLFNGIKGETIQIQSFLELLSSQSFVPQHFSFGFESFSGARQ